MFILAAADVVRALFPPTRAANKPGVLVNTHRVEYGPAGAKCACGLFFADTAHIYPDIANHLGETQNGPRAMSTRSLTGTPDFASGGLL